MQKFGLFDVIEKIAPYEKAVKNISNNVLPKQETLKNTPKTAEKPTKKVDYAPVYNLMKKHEEMSKRIDKNNEKKRS